MMLAWLSLALAADPEAAIHALTAQKHACDDAIPALDARLEANPQDSEARLHRADCRYQVGRLAWALEDVQALDVRGPDAQVLEAILLARAGRHQEASRVVRRMEKDTPARARATAVLLASRGDEGWGVLDDAIDRWPQDPHTLRAAGELAALDPDHVPARVAELLARPARFGEAYNRGVQRLNAGDGPGCLGHVAEAEALAGPTEEPVLARLGHQCATLAGELDLSATWLERAGGVGFADPNAVLAHAELMRRAGLLDASLALFTLAVPTTIEEERLRDTGRVTILTAQGDLDGALAASSDLASGVSRANLAVALRRSDRLGEALPLLEAACADMTGDGAVTCWQTVARWRQ